MRIGEAAKRAAVSTSLIRFYEEKGVLPEPRRTAAGYRDYTPDDIDLIRFAKRTQSVGFSLAEVREIVALRTESRPPCSTVRQSMTDKVAAIETQIGELRELQVDLDRLQTLATGTE